MKSCISNHRSPSCCVTSLFACAWGCAWIGVFILSSGMVTSRSLSAQTVQTASNGSTQTSDAKTEMPTQAAIAQLDTSSLRDLHSWSDSLPGSWKRCLIMTETCDEKGQTLFSSTRENRITLEAFEPSGARLRIESTVELSGSEMGGNTGTGKSKRVVFDPHPRIVIEPFLPGLPNISVTRPDTSNVTEQKSASSGKTPQSLLELPEQSSEPSNRSFGVPLEPDSEGDTSDTPPLLTPGILPVPAPGLRPLLPIRSRNAVVTRTANDSGLSDTLEPATEDATSEPLASETSGNASQQAGVLRFSKVQSETLLIDGRSIPCSVQTVSYEDAERRIVSVLYYNKQVVPHLFRRTTTIHHSQTNELLTEQTFEVHSLEKLLVFRRGEPQRRFIQSRLLERTGGNETTTYLLSLPEVPGRVVRYTMGQKNSKGRLLSAVSMSLLDFGNGESTASPTLEPSDTVLPSDTRPSEVSLPNVAAYPSRIRSLNR